MKNSIHSILAKKESSSIPLWYMRQAGRYLPEYLKLREKETDFIRFCFNPELCIEAAEQPLRRFDLDSAILFADILLIPHMMGQKVHFEKGVGPVLEKISVPDFLEHLECDKKMLLPVYETIKGLKKKLSPDKGLIGFTGAPWTIACYMIAGRSEFTQETTRIFMWQHPEVFKCLIEVLTDAISDYIICQIKAGADIIQIFDSWSSVLSVEAFHDVVIEPTAIIVERVRAAAPEVPIIGFPRGVGALAETFVWETKVNALSVDSNQPFDFLKKIQKQVPIQGNLDPMLAVVGGEPMFRQVKIIIEELREGGLIFGLSHGIVPQTPPENIFALTQFIRQNEK